MRTKKNNMKKTTIKAQISHKKPLVEDDWVVEEAAEPEVPVLRFTPTAWAKLLYFRDRSDNEVGGFGVTDPEDLLCVSEFVTVKQQVTCVSVCFDDEAVGRFFDDQVDLCRKPEQFARIWCHTHPDVYREPSITDEETFKRVFGQCQWAVMCIIARDGSTYARLSFNVGPGGQVLIPAAVDHSCEFGATDRNAWDAEYTANVCATEWLHGPCEEIGTPEESALGLCGSSRDLMGEFERMEPAQRRLLLDELAERPDFWGEEEEVMFV